MRVALEGSGTPAAWRATARHAGVNWLNDLSNRTVDVITHYVDVHRRRGDWMIAGTGAHGEQGQSRTVRMSSSTSVGQRFGRNCERRCEQLALVRR
jgi:hypothetical protein